MKVSSDPFPCGWRRIPRIGAGPVVTQDNENACGPACGEMLLRDRGYIADQRVIAGGDDGPFSERQLAIRLTQVSNRRWVGRAIILRGEPTSDLVAEICRRKGSWAALLLPGGHHYVGHWVVVDGVAQGALILVRDPVGRAYGMLADDFLPLWSYTVHVAEGGLK